MPTGNIVGQYVYLITGDKSQLDTTINKSKADMKKFASKMQQAGQKLTNIGKKLTLGLTVPITGIGIAFTKAASDAEEITNMFNAVFKEQAEATEQWAESYSDSIGLSVTETKALAASLQDTFVPLGFARDKAADLSKGLVELAGDVGSFKNVARGDVVRDFQSAIVGNTETVRKYGIVITEATLKQRAIREGISETGNDLSEQDKAWLRYQIILDGTTDAQGDLLKTQDSLANQLRRVKSQGRELAEDFGKLLIPVVKDLVGKARELVDWLNSLDEEQKKQILKMAAMAAAIGPVTAMVGGLTQAVGLLSKAIAFLAANPVVAATAALVALGAAIVAVGKRARENHIRELEEEYGDLAENAELSVEAMEQVEMALVRGGGSFADAKEQVSRLSDNLEVSKELIIDIGLQSKNVSDSYKEQLQTLKDQQTEFNIIAELQEKDELIQMRNVARREQLAQRLREQAQDEREISELQQKQVDLTERLIGLDNLIQQGAFTEEEGLQRKLELRQELLGTIQEEVARVGEASTEQINAINDQKDAITRYEQRLETIKTKHDEVDDSFDNLREKGSEAYLYLIGSAEDYGDAAEDASDKSTDALKEEEEQLKRLKQFREDFTQIIIDQTLAMSSVMGKFFSSEKVGWQEVAKMAVESIAVMIEALGKMAATEAAIAFASLNIPKGIGLTVAAASAFFVAGVVRGLADNLVSAASGAEFTTDGPQLLMVGDNPGGVEKVSVEPVSSPNYNGPSRAISVPIEIYLDGRVIYQGVEEAIENNVIKIKARMR